MTTDQLSELKALLSRELASERETNYGLVPAKWIAYAESSHGGWDPERQAHRLADLSRHGFSPAHSRILDLSAGCGQFMQAASLAGYEVYGIEPSPWKREFFRKKAALVGLPDSLPEKMVDSFGESLPFADSAFDCVTSYQTLEHVQDPRKVLAEMVRVVRVGGGIVIRCPDYRSAFEPHYRLPWLPLFPRPLARLYLKMLGRPTRGLKDIRYVTKPRLLRYLTALETNGVRLQIHDDDRANFYNGLRRKRIPALPGTYALRQCWHWCIQCCQRELSVRLFVRVLRK